MTDRHGAAQRWITDLGLRPHPEGGYFREAYRASETIAQAHLPARFAGDRVYSTAIYFLLQGDDFSALHRIQSDEIWHFYDGVPVTIHVIDPAGQYTTLRLGRDLAAGEAPLQVLPAGCWFGANLADRNGYALVGCTVAPGFDFADFELPTRAALLERYPQHAAIVEALTRPGY